MMEALDGLREDEVYIATGGSLRYALWGGLMSTRALHLNAAGAIVDGYLRDSWEIEKLGFNVFSRGIYAQDQGPRGKVIDYRCRIEIGGVVIMPGDLVFADREGELVIPRAAEAEVIGSALEKARTESKMAIGHPQRHERLRSLFDLRCDVMTGEDRSGPAPRPPEWRTRGCCCSTIATTCSSR